MNFLSDIKQEDSSFHIEDGIITCGNAIFIKEEIESFDTESENEVSRGRYKIELEENDSFEVVKGEFLESDNVSVKEVSTDKSEEISYPSTSSVGIFGEVGIKDNWIGVEKSLKANHCDVCQKDFKLKDRLKNHMQIHSGEWSFRCDICEKGFAKKSDLVRHTQIHSEERPYQCNECQRSFALREYLVRHKRIHLLGEKPFSCDVCHKTFAQKNYLAVHLRIHSVEKPYKCDICQKSFAKKSGLVIHLRIHSSERPFQCDICQKSFICNSHLSRHRRIHKRL